MSFYRPTRIRPCGTLRICNVPKPVRLPSRVLQIPTLRESGIFNTVAWGCHSHYNRESRDSMGTWSTRVPHLSLNRTSAMSPFTISSLPSDNKTEFLVRAENGATKRYSDYASKHDNVLGSCEATSLSTKQKRIVFNDGPYGLYRPPRQFDSLILLAEGMGVTFTMLCLPDTVARWKEEAQRQNHGKRHTITKRARFVRIIKTYTQLSWFEAQLQSVLEDVAACLRLQPEIPREVEITIYVTCAEALEDTNFVICSQPQPQGFSSPAYVNDVNKKSPTSLDNDITVQPVTSSSSSNERHQSQGGWFSPTAASVRTSSKTKMQLRLIKAHSESLYQSNKYYL